MNIETEKPKSTKRLEALDFILRALGNPKKPFPKKNFMPVDDELLDLLENHLPRSKL